MTGRDDAYTWTMESPWGQPLITQQIELRYTRWQDRVLAVIWPPARRRWRAYQALAGATAIELQIVQNQITSALLFAPKQ